ncbi:hypothetical protein K1719_037200 [Acacia pycnantha]|nr:hypothetical protein K1719_037200 [Acacia pycnantha]
MSILYSTIAWAASPARGVQPGRLRTPDTASLWSKLSHHPFDARKAFQGSHVEVWAYIGVAICYFPIALLGYYVFGNSVADNVLVGLEHPRWLIAAANIFVVIHVVGGYQVYAMAVFDTLETFLVAKLKFPPSSLLRFVTRTLFVVLTMLVGIVIPFFSSLLGFLGGFAFAPASYFLPYVMWLKLYKPGQALFLVMDNQLGTLHFKLL